MTHPHCVRADPKAEYTAAEHEEWMKGIDDTRCPGNLNGLWAAVLGTLDSDAQYDGPVAEKQRDKRVAIGYLTTDSEDLRAVCSMAGVEFERTLQYFTDKFNAQVLVVRCARCELREMGEDAPGKPVQTLEFRDVPSRPVEWVDRELRRKGWDRVGSAWACRECLWDVPIEGRQG